MLPAGYSMVMTSIIMGLWDLNDVLAGCHGHIYIIVLWYKLLGLK